MWKVTIFQGNELILDHSQNDFGKVMRFTMNAVVEIINSGSLDYRVVMHDKQGYVYFSAFGPKTDITGMVKVNT